MSKRGYVNLFWEDYALESGRAGVGKDGTLGLISNRKEAGGMKDGMANGNFFQQQ